MNSAERQDMAQLLRALREVGTITSGVGGRVVHLLDESRVRYTVLSIPETLLAWRRGGVVAVELLASDRWRPIGLGAVAVAGLDALASVLLGPSTDAVLAVSGPRQGLSCREREAHQTDVEDQWQQKDTDSKGGAGRPIQGAEKPICA